ATCAAIPMATPSPFPWTMSVSQTAKPATSAWRPLAAAATPQPRAPTSTHCVPPLPRPNAPASAARRSAPNKNEKRGQPMDASSVLITNEGFGAAEIVFWVAAFLLAYTYVGYPLLAWL